MLKTNIHNQASKPLPSDQWQEEVEWVVVCCLRFSWLSSAPGYGLQTTILRYFPFTVIGR